MQRRDGILCFFFSLSCQLEPSRPIHDGEEIAETSQPNPSTSSLPPTPIELPPPIPAATEDPEVETSPTVNETEERKEMPKEYFATLQFDLHWSKELVYPKKVKPYLDQNCGYGTCHENSETINLQEFPFQAQGSYALEGILNRLGSRATEHDIQKALVAELLDSMNGYMPPAFSGKPLATQEQKDDLKLWIAQDLKTAFEPPFAKLQIQQERGCNYNVDLDATSTSLELSSHHCNSASPIAIRVETLDNEPLFETSFAWSQYDESFTLKIKLDIDQTKGRK